MRNCGFILHCKLFKDLSNPAANCKNEHNPLSRSLKRNYNINLKRPSGPHGSCMVHVCCLHLEKEFRPCARGRQWCGILH